MRKDIIQINDLTLPVYTCHTIVVGSGAAGYKACDSLYREGIKDIALVTEGINMGTSRNTGSDKQTYYKLSLAGKDTDSIYDLAKTLFDGGCKHGDIALIEAAYSAKCFYKLVEYGVPFPSNEYGEYVGYKTDHDPRQRATSAGPLTSKYMVESLEKQTILKDIPIFDRYTVIAILVDQVENKTVGLLAINKNDYKNNYGLTLFNCSNIIYATGGPAGLYEASVYPQSQTGSLGIALEKGAKAVNLTESQFGIASIKFRWNLSGSYQQVIPRYVSTNQDGSDPKEFLLDYLTPADVANCTFLKGYEWPFDIRKVQNKGSSIIDILVYQEVYLKKRRVFLDFTQNPKDFTFNLLEPVAYQYLEKSLAIDDTPIKRLRKMNEPAYQLYLANNIDLEKEWLEVNVCNQHCNGGLYHDSNWESNIKHFFPVGEAAGTFGVYRPGGSALNATQVGPERASHHIKLHYYEAPLNVNTFLNIVKTQIAERIKTVKSMLKNQNAESVNTKLLRLKKRMSQYGGFIRSSSKIKEILTECIEELRSWPFNIKIKNEKELIGAFKYYDSLITQITFLKAMEAYAEKTEYSRGSCLMTNKEGILPLEKLDEVFRYKYQDRTLFDKICEITYHDGDCTVDWVKVRPLPTEDNWFEVVWKKYRKREGLE